MKPKLSVVNGNGDSLRAEGYHQFAKFITQHDQDARRRFSEIGKILGRRAKLTVASSAGKRAE